MPATSLPGSNPAPAPTFQLHFEKLGEGYRIYQDKKFLLGILKTSHNQGLYRDGCIVWEAMPRASWCIHWTDPNMPVDVMAAVLAALPKE